MDQRISFVSVAVSDLDATRAFYVDGLGWTAAMDVPDEVLMIQVGEHVVLSLWAESGFEAEVGPIRRGEGLAPITLAHNVPTREQVDDVLADDSLVLWLTDRKGNEIGVPSSKIAYIEIGSASEGRSFGFST